MGNSFGLLHLVLAVVVTALVAATVAAYLPERSRGESGLRLRLRVRAWWWMLITFTGVIAVGHGPALWIMGLVSFLAFKEFLSLVHTRPADRELLFWSYLTIPVQYWWISIDWYDMFVVFLPVYVFLALPMRMVLIGHEAGMLRATTTLHWGLMTTVFSLSHIAYLLVLTPPAKGMPPGSLVVLYLVLLTQINNIIHSHIRAHWRGTRLVPFGAAIIVTTALAAALGPFCTPMSFWHSAGAGFLIALSGFVGERVMAGVKRDIGIQDGSAQLPGRGGLLERLDSLTFAAPVFFHYLHHLYY